MESYSGSEIIDILSDKAVAKTKLPLLKLILLGVMGGAFIALGYLAFIRITGTLPAEWGSFGTFLGGCLFPIGLVAIVFVGGELTTGNMMTMTFGVLKKKTTIGHLVYNWVIVMLTNAIGGILIAYLFGHIVGLTEGAFLAKTTAVALAKVNDAPIIALVSGIGCNIFVCMAVWLGTGAKDLTAKFINLWFPIMIFVVVGFQHVVANAFIIPAAIFAGAEGVTWTAYLINFVFVFIGNGIGGAIAFAVPAYLANAPEAFNKKALKETRIPEITKHV